MIFVTVGMHDHGFNRLVQAADELAGLTNEQVVIQRGSSEFSPQHATYFEWASSNEMEEWTERSRVVVAHAGAGTIITTYLHRKNLVLAPRLAANDEVFNDHQLQLASILEKKGYAVVVSDLSGKSLFTAIERASKQKLSSFDSDRLKKAIHEKLSIWQESFQQLSK